MIGGEIMKKVQRFFKRAEISKNRIIIPKFYIDKYGRDFYMEIDEEKIIITPIKKKEGK